MRYAGQKTEAGDFRRPRFAKILAICFSLLLNHSWLHANVTVIPLNGGTLGKGNYVITPVNGVAPLPSPNYYFVTYSGFTDVTAPAFYLFAPLNITAGTASGTAADPGFTNFFQVSFVSDVASRVSGSQQAVITIQPFNSSGAGNKLAPIASVNGVACNANICQAFQQTPPGGGPSRYYAAKYTAQTSINIGFYPSDICADLQAQGVTALGCSTSPAIVQTPVPGTPTQMQLGFSVSIAADGNQLTAPTGTAIDSTASPLAFVFETDQPSFTCPSQDVLNAMVTPADGSIILDATSLTMTVAQGSATAFQFYVIGQDSALTGNPLDFTKTFQTGDSLWTGPGTFGNSGQIFTGFTNSQLNATPHEYTISFLGQDAAGVFTAPTPTPCQIYPVEVAAISGFLKKSSCFVATAAFNSADAEPVAMLREFRDRVLLPTRLGQRFVNWYYQWSPEAAEWLLAHPVFRVPVLLLLAPLEVAAWVILHPIYFLLYLSLLVITSWHFLHSVFDKGEGEPSASTTER